MLLEFININHKLVNSQMYISVCDEPGCISMVSYSDIEDVDGIIDMSKTTLEELNKVVSFVKKQEKN